MSKHTCEWYEGGEMCEECINIGRTTEKKKLIKELRKQIVKRPEEMPSVTSEQYNNIMRTLIKFIGMKEDLGVKHG